MGEAPSKEPQKGIYSIWVVRLSYEKLPNLISNFVFALF
jgi:hypothetical protein